MDTPTTSTDDEHSPPSYESLQDLMVTGKSIQQSNTAKLDSRSDTPTCRIQDELVLEDINDNDIVAGVVIVRTSCTLDDSEVEDDAGMQATTSTNLTKSEGRGKLIQQNAVEQERQERTLSRLQRLRNRMTSLVSCFRRNKVTPINI